MEILSPHPLQRSVTVDGPPPPPTPGCEEPAGVLKIRTGNLKIDLVGGLGKFPLTPPCSTCSSPPPTPPSCRGGGGDEARGVLYSLSHPKGRLRRFEQFWDIPYE